MPLRIENAIDMHCHFGPDTIGGQATGPVIIDGVDVLQHSVTGFEAAKEALDSGHKAIVLKSHSFCSCQLAASVEQAAPGLKVFGGTCTDYASGGLSVETVESALQLGAKIVWLPTVNSVEDMKHKSAERYRGLPGIPVTGEDGAPSKLVCEIVELVRGHDAVLATGHTTADEHYAVVKAFARTSKVLVTHAGEALSGPNLSPSQAKELADMGATIELTAECCVPVFNRPAKSPKKMAEMIGTIGHERCTLSSDYGWSPVVPRPAEGLKDFLEKLWDVGVTEAQLTRMVSTNPASLLSID
ncbi:DUF6282 family protein [Phenylobacterium sp. LjRoot225]|uniref:DUF6282 family protein n=1 Tax=Phenylobacterium sp. LjRoot225 TaxID=3342285 RepID=UPI003ECC5B0B